MPQAAVCPSDLPITRFSPTRGPDSSPGSCKRIQKYRHHACSTPYACSIPGTSSPSPMPHPFSHHNSVGIRIVMLGLIASRILTNCHPIASATLCLRVRPSVLLCRAVTSCVLLASVRFGSVRFRGLGYRFDGRGWLRSGTLSDETKRCMRKGVVCARWLAIMCCGGSLNTHVKESKSNAGDVNCFAWLWHVRDTN
jgi:hypothetical protein